MANLSQRAFVEAMAHSAGRFLATCNTDEKREAALGLLTTFKTKLFLQDRFFSIEKFDNRVLAVEEQFRKSMTDGWTGESFKFEGVFNARRSTSKGVKKHHRDGKSKRTA